MCCCTPCVFMRLVHLLHRLPATFTVFARQHACLSSSVGCAYSSGLFAILSVLARGTFNRMRIASRCLGPTLLVTCGTLASCVQFVEAFETTSPSNILRKQLSYLFMKPAFTQEVAQSASPLSAPFHTVLIVWGGALPCRHNEQQLSDCLGEGRPVAITWLPETSPAPLPFDSLPRVAVPLGRFAHITVPGLILLLTSPAPAFGLALSGTPALISLQYDFYGVCALCLLVLMGIALLCFLVTGGRSCLQRRRASCNSHTQAPTPLHAVVVWSLCDFVRDQFAAIPAHSAYSVFACRHLSMYFMAVLSRIADPSRQPGCHELLHTIGHVCLNIDFYANVSTPVIHRHALALLSAVRRYGTSSVNSEVLTLVCVLRSVLHDLTGQLAVRPNSGSPSQLFHFCRNVAALSACNSQLQRALVEHSQLAGKVVVVHPPFRDSANASEAVQWTQLSWPALASSPSASCICGLSSVSEQALRFSALGRRHGCVSWFLRHFRSSCCMLRTDMRLFTPAFSQQSRPSSGLLILLLSFTSVDPVDALSDHDHSVPSLSLCLFSLLLCLLLAFWPCQRLWLATNAFARYFLCLTKSGLLTLCSAVRQRHYFRVFNSTLGFPGEGPQHVASGLAVVPFDTDAFQLPLTVNPALGVPAINRISFVRYLMVRVPCNVGSSPATPPSSHRAHVTWATDVLGVPDTAKTLDPQGLRALVIKFARNRRVLVHPDKFTPAHVLLAGGTACLSLAMHTIDFAECLLLSNLNLLSLLLQGQPVSHFVLVNPEAQDIPAAVVDEPEAPASAHFISVVVRLERLPALVGVVHCDSSNMFRDAVTSPRLQVDVFGGEFSPLSDASLAACLPLPFLTSYDASLLSDYVGSRSHLSAGDILDEYLDSLGPVAAEPVLSSEAPSVANVTGPGAAPASIETPEADVALQASQPISAADSPNWFVPEHPYTGPRSAYPPVALAFELPHVTTFSPNARAEAAASRPELYSPFDPWAEMPPAGPPQQSAHAGVGGSFVGAATAAPSERTSRSQEPPESSNQWPRAWPTCAMLQSGCASIHPAPTTPQSALLSSYPHLLHSATWSASLSIVVPILEMALNAVGLPYARCTFCASGHWLSHCTRHKHWEQISLFLRAHQSAEWARPPSAAMQSWSVPGGFLVFNHVSHEIFLLASQAPADSISQLLLLQHRSQQTFLSPPPFSPPPDRPTAGVHESPAPSVEGIRPPPAPPAQGLGRQSSPAPLDTNPFPPPMYPVEAAPSSPPMEEPIEASPASLHSDASSVGHEHHSTPISQSDVSRHPVLWLASPPEQVSLRARVRSFSLLSPTFCPSSMLALPFERIQCSTLEVPK